MHSRQLGYDNEIVHRTIGRTIVSFELLDANSITFDVPLNLSFEHLFFFSRYLHTK